MKFIASIALTLLLAASLEAACAPPTLPPGSRWVENEGCTSGPTYTTTSPPREKCHCWGHCGYICRPDNGGGGGGGGGSTRPPTSTTRRPSPCPHGPIWYNPRGQRCYCQSHNQVPYYVCEGTTTTAGPTSTGVPTTTSGSTTASTTSGSTTASTTSGSTTASTTSGSTTASTTTASTTTTPAARRKRAATSTTANPSPCPHGPIWTNPRGQRCYCQTYKQTPYYVCE